MIQSPKMSTFSMEIITKTMTTITMEVMINKSLSKMATKQMQKERKKRKKLPKRRRKRKQPKRKMRKTRSLMILRHQILDQEYNLPMKLPPDKASTTC